MKRSFLSPATALGLGRCFIPSALSGGLDSSTVTALLGRKDTFSVDYIGTVFQSESDREYINRMVSFFALKHRRIILGNDELSGEDEVSVPAPFLNYRLLE